MYVTQISSSQGGAVGQSGRVIMCRLRDQNQRQIGVGRSGIGVGKAAVGVCWGGWGTK
jgi:hypothetical protein